MIQMPDNNQDKTITVSDVIKAIDNSNLPPEVQKWVMGESEYLTKLINVYVSDPDTFQLPVDMRNNPILILKTILYSAETLYGYQQAYNEALIKLAQANGIQYQDIREVPALLQAKTLSSEQAKLVDHLANGGKVAIALFGSGASGKGTIGKKSGMSRAVNYTTRIRRPTEVQGVDYYYIREMEPGLQDALDIDTGYKVIGEVNGEKQYEVGSDGKPVNYFEKYGPYLTTVYRPGRARHGTSASEFENQFANNNAIFFEQGPIQVQEAGEKLGEYIPNARVLPVCILPPESGILPLASRIAVRTYGDPTHKDPSVTDGYKITDIYLESTIGMGQIEELVMTTNFSAGENPLGIAYIVNDNLSEAVRNLKSLIGK